MTVLFGGTAVRVPFRVVGTRKQEKIGLYMLQMSHNSMTRL